MLDDGAALCLTPQAFSNVVAAADVYNNANLQFWEVKCCLSGGRWDVGDRDGVE